LLVLLSATECDGASDFFHDVASFVQTFVTLAKDVYVAWYGVGADTSFYLTRNEARRGAARRDARHGKTRRGEAWRDEARRDEVSGDGERRRRWGCFSLLVTPESRLDVADLSRAADCSRCIISRSGSVRYAWCCILVYTTSAPRSHATAPTFPSFNDMRACGHKTSGSQRRRLTYLWTCRFTRY